MSNRGFHGALAPIALTIALFIFSGCQDTQSLGPLTHKTRIVTPGATAAGDKAPASEPKVANAPIETPEAETQIIPGNGVMVQPASASVGGGEPGDITLNFVDADVHDVLPKVLGDVLHLNFTIDPKVQAMVTIQTSRPLKRDDVLPALQAALRSSGLALVQNKSGIYSLVQADQAAHSGPVPIIIGMGRQTMAQAYNIQILPLKYVAAAELQKTLTPFLPKGATMQVDTNRNLLILSGSGVDLASIIDMVQSFDIDWVKGMSFAIVPVKTASPDAVVDAMQGIFGPNGSVPLGSVLKFAPLNRMDGVLVVSPQQDYLDNARQWIERLDRGEGENQPQIYEYHVQNSRAVDVARVLTKLFSNGQVSSVEPDTSNSDSGSIMTAPGTTPTSIGSTSSPTGTTGTSGLGSGLTSVSKMDASFAKSSASQTDGTSSTDTDFGAGNAGTSGLQLPQVRIVADEKNNTLVIFAKPRTYRMIEQALQKIDVVPLQVMIEATIAEVRLGNNLQYGLQYYFNSNRNQVVFGSTPTPITGPNIPGVFPGFNYILSHTNTNIVLNLLSAITNVHVVSAPELLVLDHQTASLLVGDQIPIPTAQIQSTSSGDAPLVSTIQYVDTGVILKVTPRVNANGLITLDVSQEVSSVANTSNTATSSLGPTITQRRIQSTVTVQNGETIALGGLIQDNNQLTKNGVPVLSDIPVLGNLFRSTDRNVQRTELLVLLSPRVLHDSSEARAATDELRGRLKALQAAGDPDDIRKTNSH